MRSKFSCVHYGIFPLDLWQTFDLKKVFDSCIADRANHSFYDLWYRKEQFETFFLQNRSILKMLPLYKGFDKFFSPLTYISHKRNIWQMWSCWHFVPHDLRNNLIYCSTLFMHFEILMPIETAILKNALYEKRKRAMATNSPPEPGVYLFSWRCNSRHLFPSQGKMLG